MRVWWLHQRDGEHQVEDLYNARRLRVLRILVGRGGCFGKEMLDACIQVGWELPEAHREVESQPYNTDPLTHLPYFHQLLLTLPYHFILTNTQSRENKPDLYEPRRHIFKNQKIAAATKSVTVNAAASSHNVRQLLTSATFFNARTPCEPINCQPQEGCGGYHSLSYTIRHVCIYAKPPAVALFYSRLLREISQTEAHIKFG